MLSVSIFLSLFTLLFISMGVFYLAKLIKIPYTVLLVLVGVLMIPVSSLPFLSFLSEFKLTADLLFFIFLPTLIFESAYNLNFKSLAKNKISIGLLSIVGLLFSSFFIAIVGKFVLQLFGIDLPFIFLLLFGSIVSATDPVAVLAIFKDFGAPKRLAMIFEGESLFNDATAFALFTIILDVIRHGYYGFETIFEGFVSFIIMMIGGAIIGVLFGYVFSKILELIKNNDKVEITLTMVVAHLTFIITELLSGSVSLFGMDLHFSAIIATVSASLMIGNFGRYKISPQIEEYMDKFWEYFAFVANSMVFIMMGILFASLFSSNIVYYKPMLIMLFVVTISRAAMVYPISFLNNKICTEKLPKNWIKLLCVGDLKGALAVIMVLLIPLNLEIVGMPEMYNFRDLLTVMTIGVIFFTLFIKATSLGYIMDKLRINRFTSLEKIEYLESKSLIFSKVLTRLHNQKIKGHLDSKLYLKLKKEFEAKFVKAYHKCGKLACKSNKTFLRLLRTYAIGIEKHTFKKLYERGEINEKAYRTLLEKLDHQIEMIAKDMKNIYSTQRPEKIGFENFIHTILYGKDIKHDMISLYMYYRALRIASRKVVKVLSSIAIQSHLEEYDKKHYLHDIVEKYEEFFVNSTKKMKRVKKQDPNTIDKLNKQFARTEIAKTEEDLLHELYERDMITSKINLKLHDEIASDKI